MEYIIYSVEDDQDISRLINIALTKQGYQVNSFFDAQSFFEALNQEKPNMILLDMMLPDRHGSEILKELRCDKGYDDVEIVIISANTALMDKVDGLDLGADDYIEKPFNVLELMSRINSKVRRHKSKRQVTVDGVVLDLDRQVCIRDGEDVVLTQKEFEVLSILFLNKDKVLTRDEILNKIWNTDVAIESRTVDMHVKSLRQKVGNGLIKTVHGKGYIVNS